jgi:hypothetical protein
MLALVSVAWIQRLMNFERKISRMTRIRMRIPMTQDPKFAKNPRSPCAR